MLAEALHLPQDCAILTKKLQKKQKKNKQTKKKKKTKMYMRMASQI